MVQMSKQEALKKAFAEIDFPLDDAEVLSSCTTLLSLHSLAPEALAAKWESYALNAKLRSISMDAIAKWKPTLNKLQEQFQKKKDVEGKRKFTSGNIGLLDDLDVTSFGVADEVPKENKKKRFTVAPLPDDDEDTTIDSKSIFKSRSQTTTASNGNSSSTASTSNGTHVVVDDEKENRNINVQQSQDEEKKARFIPVIDDDVWSSSQDDADATFAQRPNIGKVEVSFMPTVKAEDEADYELWEEIEKSVNIIVESNHSMSSYRALADEMERRSAVLDERLVTIGTRIQEESMLPRPEMFHIPAQDPVVAMGRVCPDPEGVFGEKSAMLEADDEHTKARVALDLKYVSSTTGESTTAQKGYSLFPGMVVVVEGVNTNGKSLSVTDIYEPKPFPLYKSPSYSAAGQFPYAPLSILVASGPFTTSENGSYRALDLLLETVEKTNPQVVVLVGPFIDTTQPIVKNSDETFLEQFKGKIGATLTRLTGQLTSVALPPSKIILVPSLKDPSDSFSLPLLPQPPFAAKDMGLESKWLKCVSNPCTMRVNDVTIGVSSVDILKHLSGSEFSRNVQGDRMSRLCGHLIKQQSYYPLFPPAPEVSMEVTRMGAIDLPYAPDILLVPSDLQHFVRNVNDTLCINPGRLTKGKTGGTFAKITVYPRARKSETEQTEQKDVEESMRVAHRTKVEIVRI